MKIRSLTLLAVGLVVGVIGAYFFLHRSPHENANYVIAFRGVTPADEAAFIAALKVPDRAVFRRQMMIRTSGGVDQPPGLEDAGDSGSSETKPEPDRQQVTQRVGFNNKESLEKALSYLSPTPTPSPGQ